MWQIPQWSHLLKKSLMENFIFCAVTLAYRCIWICSSRTKLHNKLVCLKEIFLRNGWIFYKWMLLKIYGYHTCNKRNCSNSWKPLVLVLPYLGSMSLQTRINLKKSLKNILNCCKLQIVFNSKMLNSSRLANNFHFKDQIHNNLTSGVVYKFQCGLGHESYHGECMRHLNVRIVEHIGISPLIKQHVKPKNSSIADHLLFCNHLASYDDFSILTRESKKFLLEMKESLLIMRDKPSLTRNITSTPLYLFDRAL